MRKIILVLILIVPAVSFAQSSNADSNYIFWSKDRRLQENDFKIKVHNNSNTSSFAQFGFDYKVGSSFAFGLPKDYKKKIRNYLIKSASWIDTSRDVSVTIRYQQALFDMEEIYVRKFRKTVFENRKKIAWGKLKIDEINAQAMTGFSNRRVQYDTETNFGTIASKQKEWEDKISGELDEFKEFSAD